MSNMDLDIFPIKITKKIKIRQLNLDNNQLTSLPVEIINILTKVFIDDTSYQINNISNDTEFLIFRQLNKNLENLPIILRKLYLHKDINLTKHTIKLPFSCVIERY